MFVTASPDSTGQLRKAQDSFRNNLSPGQPDARFLKEAPRLPSVQADE
jgi:hypothetical protein